MCTVCRCTGGPHQTANVKIVIEVLCLKLTISIAVIALNAFCVDYFTIFCQLSEFAKSYEEDYKKQNKSVEHFHYHLLHSNISDLIVSTALHIYLVLMITSCTGERSFSKLKMVLN